MKFSFILAVFFLSACSSAQRSPSSLNLIDLNASVRDLMMSPSPREQSKAHVNRLLRMHLRAHGWMNELDSQFAGARGKINLFDQPNYRKLIISHSLIDRAEKKIVEIYENATKISISDVSLGSERINDDSDKAILVMAGIRDALKESRLSTAKTVMLNDLIRSLSKLRALPQLTGFLTPEFNPLEEEDLIDAAKTSGKEIESLIEDLPASDPEKEWIEKEEKELQAVENDSNRGPNAIVVSPSMGSGGNIDGFSFPKDTWAITFDDGPHEVHTEQELANLMATGTKATFFWLAKNVLLYPQIVKKVQAAGMPVENHSYMHAIETSPADLARLNTNLNKEINTSTEVDTRIYGTRPKFFRCPYGDGYKDPVIRAMIVKQGMVHVRWNVDSLDWKDHNPDSVLARVKAQMAANGKGIILFHDIQQATVLAVRKLIDTSRGKLRFVTIPQIVDELNGVAH